MISPSEIRSKAARKYTAFLKAWLEGETLFPLRIPGKMASPSTDWKRLRAWLDELVKHAKPTKKHSYKIEYAEPIRTRNHGTQTFPQAIWIENELDFLHYLGLWEEFAQFKVDVERIRTAFPGLEDWLQRRPRAVIDQAGQWADLLRVCQYFVANPQPDLYIRELPVAVHSKFIETHKGILRELLDTLLPESALVAEKTDFETRFGLRKPPITFRLRLLDPVLQSELHFPATDLSLPLEDLARLPLSDVAVIVSENLMPFLTLPYLRRGIAIFGEGNAVASLQAPWLEAAPILYWGDLDIQGFRFLAQLRMRYPQTKSLFMDLATLEKYRDFAVSGVEDGLAQPTNLSSDEVGIYQLLQRENLRLEQERVEQREVNERFA